MFGKQVAHCGWRGESGGAAVEGVKELGRVGRDRLWVAFWV